MKKLAALLLAAVLVVLGLLVHAWRDSKDGVTKLCSIPMPAHGACIVIYTDWLNEVNQNLYYEVRSGDQVRVPMCMMASVDMETTIRRDSFAVLTAPKGDLNAIVWSNDPSTVLIIYDFGTGETWPRAGSSETPESTQKRGERWLAMLREATGRKQLKLITQ